MKNIILFDIDNTLLNTNQLRERIDKRFSQTLKIELRKVTKAKDAYVATLMKSTDFNPDDYIKYTCKTFGVDRKLLEMVYFQSPNIYQRVLYPETRAVLKKFQAVYRLGIFTEGRRRFQLTKMKLSGLLPYFNQAFIFIHRRKLEPEVLKKLPPGAFIVDDKLEVAGTLLSYPNVTPIWLNRQDEKKHPRILTIYSLKDLKNVLKDQPSVSSAFAF